MPRLQTVMENKAVSSDDIVAGTVFDFDRKKKSIINHISEIIYQTI
jgi:hypothetical protein